MIEEQTKLMWAVNWRTEDKFPNCGELTWFNPDVAMNGGDEGHKNSDKNIHDWLTYVNKTGCFHDWRLPTLLELKGLLTSEISQYYHIREDVCRFKSCASSTNKATGRLFFRTNSRNSRSVSYTHLTLPTSDLV